MFFFSIRCDDFRITADIVIEYTNRIYYCFGQYIGDKTNK